MSNREQEVVVRQGDFMASWRRSGTGEGEARLVQYGREGEARTLTSTSFERVSPPHGTMASTWMARGIGAASRWLKPWSHKELGQDPHRELLQRYVEHFKNQGKFLVFPRVFSPDLRHHFDYYDTPGDMLSWVKTGQDFMSAFPDVHVTLHHILVQNDLAVEINTSRATHTGTFRTHPPTGREVTWNELHFYRIQEHRIVENWPAVDFEHIESQLC